MKVIETNNESVKLGQNSVESNGETFNQIIAAFHNVKSGPDDVEHSIQVIFQYIKELVDKINQTNDIAQSMNNRLQSIAASAEEQNSTIGEVAHASEELAELATELQSLTQQYKF